MAIVLIAYATDHGQTRKVAERIASVLGDLGHEVCLADVRHVRGEFPEQGADAILIGGSVHLGRHQQELVDFVRLRRAALLRVPSAFFSLSLSAAQDTQQSRRDLAEVLERFARDTGWNPDQVTTVAGALAYSQYGFFLRQVMRLISAIAGGDTDASRDYEYTDWQAVERFAREFATRLPAPEETHPPPAHDLHPAG